MSLAGSNMVLCFSPSEGEHIVNDTRYEVNVVVVVVVNIIATKPLIPNNGCVQYMGICHSSHAS